MKQDVQIPSSALIPFWWHLGKSLVQDVLYVCVSTHIQEEKSDWQLTSESEVHKRDMCGQCQYGSHQHIYV